MTKKQFIFDQAKQGLCWKSYYSNVFKCSDEKCNSRLKIVTKILGLNTYCLQVEYKGQHIQHDEISYKSLLEKKLKWGNTIYLMLSLICILIGINPKVQEIIDQNDLPNYGAMKCLSKLMDWIYQIFKKFYLI